MGLNVAVSTDKSLYNGGSVTATAVVSGNGAAVAGVSVAFIFTAGSNVITQAATTNGSGVATTSYRLKAKDPKGVWQVTASAAKDAVTGSGSATFMVQ